MMVYLEQKIPLYFCRRKWLVEGAFESNKIFKAPIRLG